MVELAKERLFTKERALRSVTHRGNTWRLERMFEKAARGEEITYVSIGGSITQGSNATDVSLRYSALITKWLEEKFPNTKINYISAGIGATGSLIGVHRLERDVLKYNPDFITVEFSVNEADGDEALESYDNLVYKALNYESKPAVLCIGMVDAQGNSAQITHLKTAKHYDIPYISYRDAVWNDIENGKLAWEDISNDSIHPHNAGHRLTADLVTNYLENITLNTATSDIDCSTPLVNNNFKNAKYCLVNEIAPASLGCFSPEVVNHNRIPLGWVAHKNGDPLVFELKECKRVYIIFEKTNSGKGGKAVVKAKEKEALLDSDFPNGWGSYYHNIMLYSSDTPSDLTLTVTPNLEEDKHFTVLGLMIS